MKLWGGRFQKGTDKTVEQFTASVGFDRRLATYDIMGSIAHIHMLAKQGIIGADEGLTMVMGLNEIAEEIAAGTFPWRNELEDVHMNVEARLSEKIGALAGKLHTARSRNDQVALDMRLFTRDAIMATTEQIIALQKTLLQIADAQHDAIMPGYTHLQRAQPVLLAHHLLAYFEMLQRDFERFGTTYDRCNVMPLGSGALAGTTFPIDRHAVAAELGFAAISRNSMDAVSDRDFLVEYSAAACTTMMHLSRLAEEIVLWATGEFGFVELDDAFSTGSSMMPQKKNPDVAELIRGKTGRVYGNLTAILTILKGLPLTYNRDLQEDKEGFFDTVDTLLPCLNVMCEMLASMRFRSERLRQAAGGSFALATDIADYLVRCGMPFRQAHETVGNLVSYCLETDKDFSQLSLGEYQRFSPLFDKQVFEIDVSASVAARAIEGGTAPQQVRMALQNSQVIISSNLAWLDQKTGRPASPSQA